MCEWIGYHVYLHHGTSVCWYHKTRLESGPVTADLATTVVHGYNSLRKEATPAHFRTMEFIRR